MGSVPCFLFRKEPNTTLTYMSPTLWAFTSMSPTLEAFLAQDIVDHLT